MRFAALGLVCLFVAQAESVKLTVRTLGDQTTFHIGELIPLELSFTSETPDTFQINNASYDRSGRLGLESFQVEPNSGWDDPLAGYFSAYGGFIGGGLFNYQKLSTQPAVIHQFLNEWVRFNQPGRYHVAVTSMRVSRIGADSLNQPKEVPSAELWLTIIPAIPDWQAATLEQARAVFASQKNSPDAIATLRHLGTPGAAREMARSLSDQNAFQYKFGLASTPAKDAALKIMDELLNDPDFPVNGLFLETMSLVALPADQTNHRAEARAELEAKFRRQLIDALGRKRGGALAVSAYTIIDEAAMRGHDLPENQKQRLTAELVSGFDRLPPQAQTELFQSRWRVLDKTAMLALLPKIAGHDNDQISGAALVRWWEMDPQAARPAIIREIERPHPRLGAAILGMLPDKELPEADQLLADHVSHGDQAASLISRYATAAIEPQVTAYLDEHLGKFACAVQAPLLAYVLRIDPQGAGPRLEKAVAARGDGFSACNHNLFTDVGERHNAPALEEFALRSLDDSDPQVVANAAIYLGIYGSSAAEEPLWAHMTAWSHRWQGREGEMRFMPGEKMNPLIFEGGAGTAMLSALAAGQGWLTDETKLNRLLDLSIGPNQRTQVEQYLKSFQARPRQIQFIFSAKEQFQIAQYTSHSRQMAIEKLSQFPRGTSFVWIGSIAWEGEGKALDEMSKAIAARGITIVKP